MSSGLKIIQKNPVLVNANGGSYSYLTTVNLDNNTIVTCWSNILNGDIRIFAAEINVKTGGIVGSVNIANAASQSNVALTSYATNKYALVSSQYSYVNTIKVVTDTYQTNINKLVGPITNIYQAFAGFYVTAATVSLENKFFVVGTTSLYPGIFGELFTITNANSVSSGSYVGFSTTSGTQQSSPVVVRTTSASYAVAWVETSGSFANIMLQSYNVETCTLSSTARVNQQSYTYSRSNPSISYIAGTLICSWVSNNQDGNGQGVYGQYFDANGNKKGNEFRINKQVLGNQYNPYVIAMNSQFLVVYQSDFSSEIGITARIFNPLTLTNSTFSNPILPNINQLVNSFVVTTYNEGFVITYSNNSTNPSLYVSYYDYRQVFTDSITNSATITTTTSITGSATNSGSESLTEEVSVSKTGSQSLSSSGSLSATSTLSSTVSGSESTSGTNTLSGSKSGTNSLSTTGTSTLTGTDSGSLTTTASSTGSITETVSDSKTISSSATTTDTSSLTGSGSESLTTTASSTGSITETISDSKTISSSATTTDTSSLTGSGSESLTTSLSHTDSMTKTISDTVSLSGTATQTSSQSGSFSQTQTLSKSLSQSDSLSSSSSSTISTSDTLSVSASQTASASLSQTITGTVSGTGSLSQTLSIQCERSVVNVEMHYRNIQVTSYDTSASYSYVKKVEARCRNNINKEVKCILDLRFDNANRDQTTAFHDVILINEYAIDGSRIFIDNECTGKEIIAQMYAARGYIQTHQEHYDKRDEAVYSWNTTTIPRSYCISPWNVTKIGEVVDLKVGPGQCIDATLKATFMKGIKINYQADVEMFGHDKFGNHLKDDELKWAFSCLIKHGIKPNLQHDGTKAVFHTTGVITHEALADVLVTTSGCYNPDDVNVDL
jgi:hypothetical protein